MSASVIDVLAGQHRDLSDLFERVASPDEDRPARLRELMRDLAAHIAAERRMDRQIGESGLDDAFERMEHLMVLIERRKANSPDVPDMVIELKAAFEEHVRTVSEVLVPELSARPAEEQERLGREVAGEEAALTSHPHPHLEASGPVATVLTKVASHWDHARDRTVNNRHLEDSPGDPEIT